MGTNFYRIPTHEEMVARKENLQRLIEIMDLSPKEIEREFAFIIIDGEDSSMVNPWDNFTNETLIHLGKRGVGWKFTWNFHNGNYYTNKNELLHFIRSGRVVNEYGDEQEVEEFIKMALEWGQPDGAVFNEEYNKKHGDGYHYAKDHYSKIIDGLVVSASTEFS